MNVDPKTRVCSIPNCDRKHFGNGLCNMHWQRSKNGVLLTAPVRYNRKNGETARRDEFGNKQCIQCKEFLPESKFSSHGQTVDKKQPYCAPCISVRRMLRNYGLTREDIEKMLLAQDGCGICHSKNPNGKNDWHVDHDHSCCPGTKTCGKCVRGILCSFCNKALGQFNDSVDALKNAVIYLERNRLNGRV